MAAPIAPAPVKSSDFRQRIAASTWTLETDKQLLSFVEALGDRSLKRMAGTLLTIPPRDVPWAAPYLCCWAVFSSLARWTLCMPC